MAMLRATFGMLVLAGLMLAAGSASAGTLRPLGKSDLCLTAEPTNQPGYKLSLKACANSEFQEFRKGQANVLIVAKACVEIIAVDKTRQNLIAAATQCRGLPGQSWTLSRAGLLVGANRLCLVPKGEPVEGGPIAIEQCAEDNAAALDQKWAVYGRL